MDKNKLMRLWKTDADGIVFIGTKEQFDEWAKEWYLEVPRCKDFVCTHDSDTCGIGHACGECSIFPTMSKHNAVNICTSVDCSDCVNRWECKYGNIPRGDLDKERLHFEKV